MFKEIFEALRSIRADDAALKRAVTKSIQDKDIADLVSRGIIAAKHEFLDDYSFNIKLIEWLDSKNLRFLQEIAMSERRPMRKMKAIKRVCDAAYALMRIHAEKLAGHELKLAVV
jgi:hypothetical protein